MITVTRTSKFTHKVNTMELPLTEEELSAGLQRSWSANPGIGTEHMQNIFPQLSPDQREFLMTGCTPQEWDDMLPPEDEDDEIPLPPEPEDEEAFPPPPEDVNECT